MITPRHVSIGKRGSPQVQSADACIIDRLFKSVVKTPNTNVTAIDPTCHSAPRGNQGASIRSVLVGTISLLCEDSTTLAPWGVCMSLFRIGVQAFPEGRIQERFWP